MIKICVLRASWLPLNNGEKGDLLAICGVLLRNCRSLSVLTLISRHLLVLLLSLSHVSCSLLHGVLSHY